MFNGFCCAARQGQDVPCGKDDASCSGVNRHYSAVSVQGPARTIGAEVQCLNL